MKPGRGRGWLEVGEWGEASFAEQTRMVHGHVPGCERLSKTPDDDPWYDIPPGPPVLLVVDDSDYAGHSARVRQQQRDQRPFDRGEQGNNQRGEFPPRR